MPLTKRQKQRLSEVSKMIQSSSAVKDDMVNIQLEYASELEGLIKKITMKDLESQVEIIGSSEISVFKESSKPEDPTASSGCGSTKESSKDISEIPELPSQEMAPDWAKKLWKKIAKSCHPDALSFKTLTAIEIAKRQQWFLDSRKLFEEQSWSKLLYIGVMLEEWVETIPAKSQLSMLNSEYSVITNKLQDVQNSIAWQWGTNWDNLELRLKILVSVLKSKGKEVPSRIELLQILVDLEIE